MGRQAAVLLVGVVVAAGATAGPAAAIPRKQAVKIALASLQPQRAKGPTVVFATRKALPKGSSVLEAGPRKIRRGAFTVKAPLTTRKVWLVWADLAYGAKFQHPSKIVVVDDATGTATKPLALVWWPLVGGKPAFTGPGYARQKLAVWSNIPKKATNRAPSATHADPAPALPAHATDGDCLVTIGLRDDPQAKQDFDGIENAFSRLGVRVFTPGHAAGAAADGRDLADAVDQLTKPPHNCKDVVLYIDGHGFKTGPAGVLVGHKYTPAKVVRGKQWYTVEQQTVSAADVEGILRDHRQTTFKVIVDACYSGRFVLDLPKSENPNLLILDTASRADEVSWFYLRTFTLKGKNYRSRTNNPGNSNKKGEGRSEYTNGLIAGLTAAAGSKQEVADAQAHGGSLLARLLARAPELGKGQDVARWAGFTAPLTGGAYGGRSDVANPKPPAKPDFQVTGTGWYQHFTGQSAICVRFSTSPAQPNASVIGERRGRRRQRQPQPERAPRLARPGDGPLRDHRLRRVHRPRQGDRGRQDRRLRDHRQRDVEAGLGGLPRVATPAAARRRTSPTPRAASRRSRRRCSARAAPGA